MGALWPSPRPLQEREPPTQNGFAGCRPGDKSLCRGLQRQSERSEQQCRQPGAAAAVLQEHLIGHPFLPQLALVFPRPIGLNTIHARCTTSSSGPSGRSHSPTAFRKSLTSSRTGSTGRAVRNMASKMKEAESAYKEATKLVTPSVLSLRLKPEWEAATPLFERAAMLFKVRGVHGGQAGGARRAAGPPAQPWPAHHCCCRWLVTSAGPRSAMSARPLGRSGRSQAGMLPRT